MFRKPSNYALAIAALGLLHSSVQTAQAELVINNKSNKALIAWAEGTATTITIKPMETKKIAPSEENRNSDAWYFYFQNTRTAEEIDYIRSITTKSPLSEVKRWNRRTMYENSQRDVSIAGITNRNKAILHQLYSKDPSAGFSDQDYLAFLAHSKPEPVLNWRNASVTCDVVNDTPNTVKLTRTSFKFGSDLQRVRVPDLVQQKLNSRLTAEMRSLPLQIVSQKIKTSVVPGSPARTLHNGQDLVIQPGQVFSQDPAPNTQVPANTRIYVMQLDN